MTKHTIYTVNATWSDGYHELTNVRSVQPTLEKATVEMNKLREYEVDNAEYLTFHVEKNYYA